MTENKIGRYLENPLDKFQSYSVHYVMVACRTTVTAENFALGNNEEASLQAITAVNNLGDPVKLPGLTGAEDVYLVLDTRRFSQFTVENLKYDVMINGLQAGESTSNLATELQMTVLDSVGISFANFMQWLLNEQMRTNFDGIIFMLRIIFVGHNPDGSSETVQSETIPMILTRMDINLDYAKGAYTLDFLPNMNFKASKIQRYLTISTATSFTSGTGVTLKAAIQNFEVRLNADSETYYQKIQAILGVKPGEKPRGRPVRYMITIPQRWDGFLIDGPSIGSAPEILYLKVGDKEKAAAEAKNGVKKEDPKTPRNNSTACISVDAGRLITDVLDKLFSQVPDIAKLGNFESKVEKASDPDEVIFYKQIVGITSDDDSIVVHVDVVEFVVANVFSARTLNAAPQVANKDSKFYDEVIEGNLVKRVPKDFISYDYIFTGKNKDILSFDMKIQEFQMLLASNLKIGDSETRRVSAKDGDLEKVDLAKVDELISLRDYDPLPLPFDSQKSLNNFNMYNSLNKGREIAARERQEAQIYASNLSKFYASCPISASLTIKGNPEIMHKFNNSNSLEHKTGGKPDITLPHNTKNNIDNWNGEKEAYRKNLEEKILNENPSTFSKPVNGSFKAEAKPLSEKNYAVCPVYVRINVMGPDVDFRTNYTNSNKMVNSNVLSDNFYTVFRVTNIISGHNFTQELELYSHNIFGNNKNKPENEKK